VNNLERQGNNVFTFQLVRSSNTNKTLIIWGLAFHGKEGRHIRGNKYPGRVPAKGPENMSLPVKYPFPPKKKKTRVAEDKLWSPKIVLVFSSVLFVRQVPASKSKQKIQSKIKSDSPCNKVSRVYTQGTQGSPDIIL